MGSVSKEDKGKISITKPETDRWKSLQYNITIDLYIMKLPIYKEGALKSPPNIMLYFIKCIK